MKAIRWTQYGPPDVLQLQEVPQPIPKAGEIRIKIRAAGVTAGDCEMRRLQLPLGLSLPVRLYAGLLRPTRIPILGQELAGEVEALGQGVRSYRVGDPVFGTTGFGFGAYAEYICLPEYPQDAQGVLAPKPANLTFEEAATVPTAAFEALHFMKSANVQPGSKVLIIGAGGSIGTFSIQLARYFGAEVTGVDSTAKLDLMRSIGADHVIDYTQEDYPRADATYDLIVDVVGRGSVTRRLGLLKAGGVYFLAFARLSHIALAGWISLTSKKQLSIQSADQKKANLITLAELLDAGKIRSVIDRIYPLEQAAEAHRYAEGGGKCGNVVISVGDGGDFTNFESGRN